MADCQVIQKNAAQRPQSHPLRQSILRTGAPGVHSSGVIVSDWESLKPRERTPWVGVISLCSIPIKQDRIDPFSKRLESLLKAGKNRFQGLALLDHFEGFF